MTWLIILRLGTRDVHETCLCCLEMLPSLCVSTDTILTCTQSGCMIIQITIRLLSYSAFVYRAYLSSHDGGFYVLVPALTNTITLICMISWYHLLVYCPQKDTEFGNNTVFRLKCTDSPFSFIHHKAQRRLFGSVIDTIDECAHCSFSLGSTQNDCLFLQI